MGSFSFNPPLSLIEERRWFLAVTSFEAHNSVFIITDENKSFSISILGRWRISDSLIERINDKLKILLKLSSQNDIELHVKEVEMSKYL